MIRLQALTEWTTDADGTNIWQLWLDLMDAGVLVDGDSCTDQPSEQPAANIQPDPNAVVVELKLHQAAYDWLYNDNSYGPGAILWSETI